MIRVCARRFVWRRWVLLVGLGVLLGPTRPGWTGELYRYEDEAGRVHYVDHPSKLPDPKGAERVPQEGPGAVPINVAPGAGSAQEQSTTAPAAAVKERSATCRLAFVKRRRERRDSDLVYFGTVRNAGPGTAKGVIVVLEDHDAEGRVVRSYEARLRPSTLDAGDSGRFEIVIEERERDQNRADELFKKSKFEVRHAQCV